MICYFDINEMCIGCSADLTKDELDQTIARNVEIIDYGYYDCPLTYNPMGKTAVELCLYARLKEKYNKKDF